MSCQVEKQASYLSFLFSHLHYYFLSQAYNLPNNKHRSPNLLETILQKHFQSFSGKYSEKHCTKYGKIRLERFESFKDSLICDYAKGVARIQCSNPECRHGIFRPFSCKRFYFCPSCTRKRAILFGEHISDEVLLGLLHRHFVFAFSKMLRSFA
jgi:hypothetical protein